MTSPVYKQPKKQDSYDQLVKRNRILTRKLRDTIRQFSSRVENLEADCDRLQKQVEHLSSFAGSPDRGLGCPQINNTK